MDNDSIGFIGIGNMGRPMATRLLQAGKHLTIFDLNAEAVRALTALGATAAGSPAEVANTVETVLLSLPTPPIVHAVALDRNGVAEGTKVKWVVDFSTIGPAAAKLVSDGLARKGITYIDSPVSGGVHGAKAGTLALMVSGPKDIYTELTLLLQICGKTFHVGEEAGMAQTVKLANNLLSATAVAASSEAVVMGVKAGIDPKILLEVLNASSGRNSATLDKFPRSILPGTFDFGFATGLAYKDVRLCIEEAELMGVPMVVGAAVREMLAITRSLFGENSDYTSLCRVVESWAGVEVRG
jgi:3-hydroxyisobutyrate dehydrogenase-like beta-hydroxyacid dehydrogenase